MAFHPIWRSPAAEQYAKLRAGALAAKAGRDKSGRTKSSKQEGLFKQVHKSVTLLLENPKHPGLKTHEFESVINPYDHKKKVFEAYAQNNTPGAYRVIWCYGPKPGELTLLAIIPHPD